jgi:hypothetical protein
MNLILKKLKLLSLIVIHVLIFDFYLDFYNILQHLLKSHGDFSENVVSHIQSYIYIYI